MLQKIFSLPYPFHVLVVDDGSPDGTADIVKTYREKYPDKLFIEERKGKLGLGTAYIHGFKWALAKGYEFIFEMDCDFSHNPDDLIRLKTACDNGADLAIGSRYVTGGKIKNWPLDRLLMSYFASIYVRMVLWIGIKDTTAGFKCYRKRVLEKIKLNEVRYVGYAFQIEMKYRTRKAGYKITEVPITFTDRQFGTSKMSGKIFKEGLLGVLQLRFMKF
jgi:dolichol-phosphate mannosyltransferase